MHIKQIMVLAIGFAIFSINTQACEGDCVMCHPKLIKENGKMDEDHAILVSCKTCHTQEEMEKIDMGSGCGQDCWDCHDIKKVTASNVPEHRGLQKCIDCHLSIDRTLLGGVTTSAFSELPTLNDLMSQEITVDTLSDEKSMDKLEEKKEDISVAPVVIEEKEIKEVQVEVKEEKSILEKISDFFKSLWLKIMSIFS